MSTARTLAAVLLVVLAGVVTPATAAADSSPPAPHPPAASDQFSASGENATVARSAPSRATARASSTQLDFGDAPDPTYPTSLASNGSRHDLGSINRIGLGHGISHESDALASDTHDDGVRWVSEHTIEVTVHFERWIHYTSAYLNVLVDRDGDGDWEEPGDLVVDDRVVSGWAGWGSDVTRVVRLQLPVNRCAYVDDPTWMRVTATFHPIESYNGTGAYGRGESEDYLVDGAGCEYDFGDAPDPTYPTTASSDGARHLDEGYARLGATVSTESAPRATDTGDDGLAWVDQDTVRLQATSNYGNRDVTVNVLLDRDGDGDWNESGDWIVRNASRTLDAAGEAHLTVDLPASRCRYPRDDPTWLRVTLTNRSVDDYDGTGSFAVGETEDYRVNASADCEYDFGDAPDPGYPTNASSDGARHVDPTVAWLGDDATAEPAPRSPDAHDDGVSLVDPDTIRVNVTSNYGLREFHVNVLLDRNRTGNWSDAGDWVARNVRVVTNARGEASVLIDLPRPLCARGPPGQSWLRVTLTERSVGTFTGTGTFAVGETEDYPVSEFDCARGGGTGGGNGGGNNGTGAGNGGGDGRSGSTPLGPTPSGTHRAAVLPR